MAQKMTLTAYLAQRGKKAKALTKGEAELLGIPYPLQAGWPRKYGGLEIDPEMLARLGVYVEAANIAAAKRIEEGRAKAREKLTRAEMASGPVESAAFPGFVLRQARRFRSRKSAPWG